MTRLTPQLQGKRAPAVLRLAFSSLFAGGLWWALTGGDASSWALGIPAVILAGFAVLASPAPFQYVPRPLGALRFLGFFLVQSFKAGVDVAYRAFSPGMPLNPGFVPFDTGLPRGAPRTVFMAVIGLLPGTLTVRPEGPRLFIHVLDTTMPIHQSLSALERRVAGLYGIRLTVDRDRSRE